MCFWQILSYWVPVTVKCGAFVLHKSDNEAVACHCGTLGSISGDCVVVKWHLSRCCPSVFSIPSLIIPPLLQTSVTAP
jgi:hypothetical protein